MNYPRAATQEAGVPRMPPRVAPRPLRAYKTLGPPPRFHRSLGVISPAPDPFVERARTCMPRGAPRRKALLARPRDAERTPWRWNPEA